MFNIVLTFPVNYFIDENMSFPALLSTAKTFKTDIIFVSLNCCFTIKSES